jgi:lipid II:glycine glycyltransferase (peptidoglycan interpeptide bridge formation enzyme)
MESGSLKPEKLQVRTMHLQKALDKYLKNELKTHIVSIRFSPFNTDARPFIWDGYDVSPAYTYIYNLKTGTEAIWLDFSRGVRKDINKAQKSGISIEQGGIEDAEFVYDKVAARHRINLSKVFVMDIVRSFSPDNCSIFIARLSEERLSGLIVLHYGNYAYGWIGFPRLEGDKLHTNEILMWEVIKWAHAKGYHTLENMGADDLTTFQFKRKFNPTLQSYFTTTKASFVFRSYRYLKRLITPPHYELEEYKDGE